MTSLDHYIEQLLLHGRAWFSRAEAQASIGTGSGALSAAITRLIKRRRLANPRHGFYLVLREEDQLVGAPDPARWIDPLMHFQGIDYRISLLRAAAFHGASHQAAMVLQVIVPRQLRDIVIGRHRLQFVYQVESSFAGANCAGNLQRLQTDAGFAQVAGVELTLLDCTRYFHKAGGLNAVAQIVLDIGGKADPAILASVAENFESTTVRRLGYLLELAGHSRQSEALAPLARQAKSSVPLDPSCQPLLEFTHSHAITSNKWKLVIHEPVEFDA
jgi:predicted transcriptional regulator of viral defense system